MTQETLLMLIVVAVAGLLLGLLIGMALGKKSPGGEAKKAQKELEDYKAAVSQHFGKTADLVDNLTNSYRDVFEHLGTSAKELLSEEDVKRHLQSRAEKAVTLTYITEKNVDIDEVVKVDVTAESVESDKEEPDAGDVVAANDVSDATLEEASSKKTESKKEKQ